MTVVPGPRACGIHAFPSGDTAVAHPAQTGGAVVRTSSPARPSSTQKRSRQCERRRQQQALPTAPGLWRRPDSDGGGGGGGGDGDGDGGGGGHAEWRMCNKENIDPRTGRHVQHPFSPFSPFSASLLVGHDTPPAFSAAAAASGRANRSVIVQKHLFCGNGCGDGGQVRLRPAAAISRKPFGEPLRKPWSSRRSG